MHDFSKKKIILKEKSTKWPQKIKILSRMKENKKNEEHDGLQINKRKKFKRKKQYKKQEGCECVIKLKNIKLPTKKW